MSNAHPSPAPNSEGRDERLARLLRKARELPRVPGVYLMKDRHGTVVYVGKALSLPDRVSSYFLPSADLGGSRQRMLAVVHDFDFIECETEWEALLAENRLIKDLRPRFNTLLKDDKTFPYLVVTMRDDFPRVVITRAPADEDFRGAKVFGPFVSGGALRQAVRMLQRIFRFRTCHLDIIAGNPANDRFRPCLLHAIHQCTAPCANRISREAYREDISRLLRFLESRRSVMLRELREEMQRAADAMEYERAATLRDQIRAIEKLDERSTIDAGWQPETERVIIDPARGLASLQKTLTLEQPIRCIECIDIAHLGGSETVGSKVCFIDGRPLKSEYRRYRIRTVEGGNDDCAAIQEVVSRRYRDAGEGQELFPDLIVIDGGPGQLNAALDIFARLKVRPPMVVALAKKEELVYVQGRSEPLRLPRTNAGLRLLQAVRDEAHRFAQHYHHVLRRKKTLGEDESGT